MSATSPATSTTATSWRRCRPTIPARTNAFFSWYKNDEVVDLLAKARATSVEAERAELYRQIQDIVYHDGYSVPLNFLPYVAAYGPQVKNWRDITVGWWWLKNVWLAQ